MKKYETLDGKLIELNDYNQYSLGEGWALSKIMLDRMVVHGIIRERKLTIQDLAAELDYTYPGSIRHDSPTGQLLQRIIDKDLVDQILADD